MPSLEALTETHLDGTLVVIDIGYSETSASCGVAWPGGDACCLRFGECVDRVSHLLRAVTDQVILVVEAPLSTCHDQSGNPTIRGRFEAGRGWYYGAGATVTLAAMRFVDQLAGRVGADNRLLFAEAFLSNKRGPSCHAEDAAVILDEFWRRPPEALKESVTPIMGIAGIPSVRVFRASSNEKRALS